MCLRTAFECKGQENEAWKNLGYLWVLYGLNTTTDLFQEITAGKKKEIFLSFPMHLQADHFYLFDCSLTNPCQPQNRKKKKSHSWWNNVTINLLARLTVYCVGNVFWLWDIHVALPRNSTWLEFVCDIHVPWPDIKLPLSQAQYSTQNRSRMYPYSHVNVMLRSWPNISVKQKKKKEKRKDQTHESICHGFSYLLEKGTM